MASRLLLLLLGARQAAAAPTCLRDVANSSSRAPCRCADSSGERWAFVSCNWPVLDGGFKEQGWNGLLLAGANNSACVEAVLTSSSGTDCTTAAVEQAAALVSTYTAIYSAGFELGDGIKAAALSHPEINFATADVAFSSDLPNLQGILFAEEQAAFLAGYLAGLVTSTGVVGAVLGPEIAPVIRFANGFTNGALDACALLGKSCISIRKYIPSFGDGERGWRVAELLSLRGADVIFEAGGYTGACGVAGASSLARVRAVVGVDVDRYLQPNACALGVVNTSKVITSAVKRIDQAIIQVAQSQLDNTFTAGDKIFAADRDAIGISPCHDACSISLDCGSVSCSVASTGVGTTVASAREHILSTIFPAFASGDSILANTRVNTADGSVVHDFGVPNERTQLSVSSTARWAQVGALGVGLALSGHTSVTIELFNPFGGEAGGRPKVIIFGGQTTGGYSNELLIFIPDDSTYSFLDGANGTYGAPAPRADHSAILDGNNVMWVFFGRTASGVTGDVWSIDLSASQNVWVEHVRTGSAGVGIEREGHSSCLFNSGRQALIFGGVAASGAMRNDLWIFDLQTHSWAEVVATYRPAARRKHTATVIGEKMYIFGGTNAQRDELVDLWSYASGEGWVLLTPSTPSSLLPRWNHAAVVWNTQTEGPLLAITGGQSGTSLLDDLHVYSPSANSWTKRLSFGAHVHKQSAHSAAEIGGRIYMISGIVQTATGSAERTADIYVHNADEPLEPPSLVSATTNTITLGWYASNSYTQGGSDSCSCFASIVSEYQLQLVSRGGYTTLYYGDLTSFTVQGLESGSAYEFRIRGGGILGFTGWSAGITHNTTRLSKVAQPVTEVRVGILLPLFGLDGGSQSWSPRVGVYQAIREINNKSDGVADHLIPKTKLLIAFRESKCDATTSLTAALQLTRESFGSEGVNVIIGAGCSGASESAAVVASGSSVPIISPSASSPTLSDGRLYPLFLRTCPSDASTATGMVDVLLNLFKYSSVALVSSSDAYGVGGASAFSDVAVAANLTLAASVTFLKEAVEFKTQHRILLSSSASVIVLFAQGQEGYRFVRSALTVGIGGDGYLWMVGDPTLADESFWAGEIDTRQEALKGLFSFDASKGQGSIRYEAYRERRRQLPPMSNGSWCNLEKDDDGTYLWGQELFQNSSTPLRCAGDDPDREAQFDPFGYDAVFAVVHALHELIEVQNRSSIVGSDLLNVLLTQVRFEGITGLIDFHAASDDPSLWRQGDRLTGFKYTLHNYVDNVQGLLPVGSWSPCAPDPCEWEDRWQSNGRELTFSTSNNQRPQQTASCPYGEIFSDEGKCICNDGFELDASGNRCRRCEVGQDSLKATFNESGSDGCTICAVDYYRPNAHSPASACTLCSAISGVHCPSNTTIETLFLNPGYWRHSSSTLETWYCRNNGARSPCVGGDDAGRNGDGYCEEGYHGPRCELCSGSEYSKYFSKIDASCYDCGDATTHAAIVGSSLLVLLAAVAAGVVALSWYTPCHPVYANILRLRSYILKLWQRAGMRCKTKAIVGLYQCIAAVPSVFNVVAPEGLEHYIRWIQVLEFDFSLNAIIPDSCFGSYHRRLLIGSLWPICLILLVGVASAVQQLAAVAKKETIHLRHVADKVRVGLQRVLPLALVATFVLVPSTATRIFKSFLCDVIEYNEQENRRYLHDDLYQDCDDPSYRTLQHIALVMIVIWPLGVPFLYAVLLWSSRDAVRIGKHTRLSRATAFLAGDYKHSVIWWEPVEMCRKLTLTGWVLLIPSDTELARVLVALIVSIAFLALQLSLKPFKRPEDGTLMMVVQLVLVLVYTCVALIKTCNLSTDVCVKYGFGGTASGIYQFFILFGLTMLIFQIFSAVVKLWIEGRLPKILLVARAHSVPLSTIVSRVLLRRGNTLRRQLVTKLKLDMPRLSPQTVAAIYQFRSTRGRAQTADVPDVVSPVVVGSLAELHINHVFPTTWCFVQVDLDAFVLRWAHGLFINLHLVQGIKQIFSQDQDKHWQRNLFRLVTLEPLRQTSIRKSGGHKADSLRSQAVSDSARISRDISDAHQDTTAERISNKICSNAPEKERAERADSRRRHRLDKWLAKSASRGCRRLSHASHTFRHSRTSTVQIMFSGDGGVIRVLELKMSDQRASQWVKGLHAVITMVPNWTTLAHWRWAQSCLTACSKRGASGLLHRSELRALLRRANASPMVTDVDIKAALDSVYSEEAHLEVHRWLQDTDDANCRHGSSLNLRQVMGVLLRLSSFSRHLSELFNRYSDKSLMDMPDWLSFVSEQQLLIPLNHQPLPQYAEHNLPETEMGTSQKRFERMVRAARNHKDPLAEAKINLLQFSHLILSSDNNAVVPARNIREDNHLEEPFSHYWTACSHNSYIVGDQLTGISTADAYRRQLLQGCRQVEIDCWDKQDQPIVTHGNTFCTSESFREVVSAIAECAFVTSDFPVVISLEMHCSPPVQRQIADILHLFLGDKILLYDELNRSGRAALFSPSELKKRVLIKGKVKQLKKDTLTPTGRGVGRLRVLRQFSPSAYKDCRYLSAQGDLSARWRSFSDSRRGSTSDGDEESRKYPEMSFNRSDQGERAARKLSRMASSKTVFTEEYYASFLCLRSLPVASFLSDDPPIIWPLPITSINEDRLLKELGLSRAERNAIECLHFGTTGSRQLRSEFGLTEERMSASAISRLAANPTPEVNQLQRRTRSWLLRPYPLGLRFSGKNMSPLPGWLAGAQSVALNMSNNDLPVHLHFALFHGSGGYVLKPPAMRGIVAEDSWTKDDFWPPIRDRLHRAQIDILSLHNLPKRSEQRPRFGEGRGDLHRYVPQLSGSVVQPDNSDVSSPTLSMSLHPIGGFCAISCEFPISHDKAVTEVEVAGVHRNGMNAPINKTVHCLAAEPHATFLRVSIADGVQEVAYESAVLGRLRSGYRVLHLRSTFGTRIELCYLFVKISSSSTLNLHAGPRMQEHQFRELRQRIFDLENQRNSCSV